MDIIQKQDRGTLTEKSKVKSSTSTKEEKEQLIISKAASVTASMAAKSERKKTDAKKLKKKLLEVAEQNQSLAKTIHDKNHEIADLRRSVQSLNDVLNSVPIDELRCNSSIASSKILDLSKKNRQLRAELETTKNRINKKDVQVQKLERELKALDGKLQQDTELVRKGNNQPVDELQSKLGTIQQKLFESRNKNSELQTQLKLALKCLQQEVGESFNLNNLASSAAQSNWRGRAQQILILQQRMHELKERLEVYENHGRLVSGYDSHESPSRGCSSTATTTNTTTTSGSSNMQQQQAIDRFAPAARKSEILHRAKVETLEKEIFTLKTQLDEQRGKILALKVRNKTLNDDVLKYKMKSCSLEEQTDYNGMNLASMNEKLNVQKYQFENRIEEICREVSLETRKREEAEYKEETMRTKLENMEEVLNHKEDFIGQLKETVQRLETDLKAVCGGFLFSCRELRKEEFIAILDSLEAEKNMLMEHNKTLNDRVEQERTKCENLTESLSKQKIRVCRLEAKIRELEKELDVQAERKKRSQRIADYANSVSSTSLCSFVFENSSVASMAMNSVQTMHEDGLQLDDLKNQLEFASEKITLLEEKIMHMSEERDIDLKTFQEIVGNTKHIMLDAIMAHKSAGSDTENELGGAMMDAA